MINLQNIDIAGCQSLLSLPDSFCDLTNLKTLKLGGNGYSCEKLESLPERFEQLNNLEDLSLVNCVNLRSLPEGVSYSNTMVLCTTTAPSFY